MQRAFIDDRYVVERLLGRGYGVGARGKFLSMRNRHRKKKSKGRDSGRKRRSRGRSRSRKRRSKGRSSSKKKKSGGRKESRFELDEGPSAALFHRQGGLLRGADEEIPGCQGDSRTISELRINLARTLPAALS